MTAFPKRTVLVLTALLLLNGFGTALAAGDDPVLKRMDTVLEENNRLREEAWKARKKGKEAAHQASEAFEASEARLERTRIEALAHVAEVSPAQVEGMRKEGKSWGQVAGGLGVHPGFLGIGKAPMYEPPSVQRAMAKSKVKTQKSKRGAKVSKKSAKVQKTAPKATVQHGKKAAKKKK